MLKCMVCGKQLHYVNNTHLKGHRLTVQQYKIMFSAEIFTQEFLQKRKASCQGSQGRVFQRACPRCGSAFTTGNPKTFYCRRCQPIVSIEKRRRYQRRYRRTRKRTIGREPFRILGTFSERHLSIHKGRVLAAVLLERDIGPNRSWAHEPINVQCEDCGSNMLIVVIDHETYCAECGSRILLARENEHYTIPLEPVCPSCGLVYVVPQSPFFLFGVKNMKGKATLEELRVDSRLHGKTKNMFLEIKQVNGLTKNSDVVRLVVTAYFREILPRKRHQ